MSIIITGLEMPTERESLNLTIKYNGTVLDTETGIQIAEAQEVPPHGRLIDADELYKKMERCTDYGGAAGYHDDSLIHRDNILFAIEEAPTVIPAELPIHHGTFAAASEQEALKRIDPVDDSKLSATIKCGGAVTCKEYVDTARNLQWTGTHNGEHTTQVKENET